MSVVETLVAPQVGQVVALPLDRVRPADDNVRSDVGDVSGLAASIKERGLLQPVLVYPADDDGVHELIAGHRRYAAHVLAGLDTIDAIVRALPVEDLDAETRADRIVENVQRENLTVLDEARAYQALAELGWKQRKIADRVGVNQSHVSKRIKLAALPPDVLIAVSDGHVRIEDALALARLQQRDPDAAEEILAAARQPQRWGPDPDMPDWDELVDAQHQLDALDREQRRLEVLAELQQAHDAGDGPPVFDPGKGVHRYELSRHGALPLDDWTMRERKVTPKRAAKDGTLAVAVLYDGTTVEVCTDPGRYRKDKVAAREPTATDLSDEARRAFVGQLLTLGSDWEPPDADELLIDLLNSWMWQIANGQDLLEVARWLGLDVKRSAGKSELEHALKALVTTGDRDTDTAAARRIVQALLWRRCEWSGIGGYGGIYPHKVAYLEQLQAAGHELSEVEATWLGKANQEGTAE